MDNNNTLYEIRDAVNKLGNIQMQNMEYLKEIKNKLK